MDKPNSNPKSTPQGDTLNTTPGPEESAHPMDSTKTGQESQRPSAAFPEPSTVDEPNRYLSKIISCSRWSR